MAILDKLKSWRLRVTVILLLAMSLAVLTKDVEKVLIIKTDHAKTAVEYYINKARSLAQEVKKVYIPKEMHLPPSEPHTNEKPLKELRPDYIRFGIQTSQGGLPSPSYGVQPDNLATYSAQAKHACTLTGHPNTFISLSPALIIIAAVILLIIQSDKTGETLELITHSPQERW